MEQANGTVKLPVWMKMLSSQDGKSAIESDQELLKKIATALSENKTVTLLHNGKPVKIYKDSDNQIRIEPYQSVKYIIE